MKVAIIGAGATGLVSAKYALDANLHCDVYEQTGTIGGTWIYTDRVDVDENGIPVHSSMYEGMRTNLPKETMTFLDFPYPEYDRSYLTAPEVVNYFNRFADQFGLRSYIKYYKCVTKVVPLPNLKWEVSFTDVKTKNQEMCRYDGVFICNGHFFDPMIPKLPGQELFKGVQIHSHRYRNSKPYQDKRVLVVGAGSSGQDIAVIISRVAELVFLSHGVKQLYIKAPDNLVEKKLLKAFDEDGAEFEDGSREKFDCVLYCTGYHYAFPFLTEECGISVDDKCIYPLYKHIVNIKRPTMYFIGIPFLTCIIPMADIQARFALAAFTGKFFLPSTESMMEEIESTMRENEKLGISRRRTHQLGVNEQKFYFQDLADTSGIRRLPSYIDKLYALLKMEGRNLNRCFKIIDNDNFIEIA